MTSTEKKINKIWNLLAGFLFVRNYSCSFFLSIQGHRKIDYKVNSTSSTALRNLSNKITLCEECARNTGLFEKIVVVLTTCHTQYT